MPGSEPEFAGLRVVVTRPAHQAQPLLEQIRRAGGVPIAFPTLAIEPFKPDASQVAYLRHSEAVIFVSPNAVRYGLPILGLAAANEKRLYAVGRATQRSLEDQGCRDVRTGAEDGFTSEALLRIPALGDIANTRFCIVRGIGGRDKLQRILSARGAQVAYLECYRRCMPPCPHHNALTEALDDGGKVVIVITSVTGLHNLLEMVPQTYRARLMARPLVVIGGRQKAAALASAWRGRVLESPAGDQQIVRAIATWHGQS